MNNTQLLTYIAIGSNLGDRHQLVQEAADRIHHLPHTRVIRTSSWHETEPVDLPPGAHSFINGVAEIQTDLLPIQLMKELLQIEKEMGRVRDAAGYQSRTIDLDILLYGDEIVNQDGLTIPHPRMLERLFVLLPLHELCPERIIPGVHITVQESYQRLPSSQSCFQSAAE